MDRRTDKTYTICVNYGNNNWTRGSGWVKGQSARLASIDNTGNKGQKDRVIILCFTSFLDCPSGVHCPGQTAIF
uniref:Uncharacterized protein n=1 Tax=Setaria digitata TaxID=48799 RepID=A0A915Q2F7_9BILA